VPGIVPLRNQKGIVMVFLISKIKKIFVTVVNSTVTAGVFMTLFAWFGVTGCDIKRESIGADDEIVIVASHENHKAIRSALGQIFSDTIYTPQPEPVYRIKFAEPDGFNKLERQTNLIIGNIGTDRTDPGTRLVQQLLGPERFRETIEGDRQIIFTRDQFAQNQLFMILSAPTESKLKQAIRGKEEWIRNQFEKQFEKRQGKFLFDRARRKKLEKRFLKEYGWEIKIPWGWVVIHDSSEVNFVWIGREMPYQWISIHWEPGAVVNDSLEVAKYLWEFPEKFYGNIRYNKYRYSIKLTEFNRWPAWRARGIWESTEEAQGGPFISYLFYDGQSDRTYHLNMLIFHPGKDKSLYLRQLDLIAHTFTVKK